MHSAHAGEAIPIKNDILAVYTRCYSDIVPFQQAGCAEYILCRVSGELRLIVRARRSGEEKARIAQCELCGVPETAARGLLQFLYENAVSVENVCDVVQDVFFAAGTAGHDGQTAAGPRP